MASNEREPTHREDAAHVAFLVETAKSERFEEAVAALARDWEDRVSVRLLGPLAPDMVTVSLRVLITSVSGALEPPGYD